MTGVIYKAVRVENEVGHLSKTVGFSFVLNVKDMFSN